MKNIENIKSILITKFKHIGDVLMLTPVVSVLKEYFPEASICVVVHKGTEGVLTNNPDIDRIIVFDRDLKRQGFFNNIKGQLKLIADIKSTKPDLSLELTGGDRGAIFSFLSGAPIRIGFAKVGKGMLGRDMCFTALAGAKDALVHAAQSDLNILKGLGLEADIKKYRLKLYVSEADRQVAAAIYKEHNIKEEDFVVFVHPVSRWLFKCWEDDKVAALCDYLKEKYKAVVIFSGGVAKEEQSKIANIISHLKDKEKTVNLSGKLTLEVMAAVLEKSHMFFGVDTAMMHMAAALEKPMVVVFGPTGTHNWGPLNEQAIIINKDQMECLPCGKAGCNNTKESKCLSMIEVAEVTEAFDNLISLVF